MSRLWYRRQLNKTDLIQRRTIEKQVQLGGARPALHQVSLYGVGVPIHDDRKWFEFLILEGAQAGLSWLTILKKRPNYRQAFDNFIPKR